MGNVLLLLVAADWVLQQPGVEAHRAATVSAYVLQGVAALLLAAEWLPGAVAVFTPADKNKLTTGKDTCLNENSAGACPTFAGTPPVSGQGSGTNGAIGTWDVGRVTSMATGETSSSSSCPAAVLSRSSLLFSLSSCDALTLAFPLSAPLLFLSCCCCVFPSWFPSLSLPHTCLRPLLLLVFEGASDFNQDLSSWDVSRVTTMSNSESCLPVPSPLTSSCRGVVSSLSPSLLSLLSLSLFL